MAVQKSKVTRSRRNKRRTHDSLSDRALSVDNATGEVHRRHHVTSDGLSLIHILTLPTICSV